MKYRTYYLQQDVDRDLYVFMILSFFLIISVLLLFNYAPVTEFDFFISNIFHYKVGVYSHVYPFQSMVISNLLTFMIPVSGLILSLRRKMIPISFDEIEKLGGIFERNLIKNFFKKISGLISIFVILLMCLYTVYFSCIDLSESSERNYFIYDNFLFLFILLYFYFVLYSLVFSLFISVLRHPIIYFSNNFYFNYYKVDKVRFLFDKHKSNKNH